MGSKIDEKWLAPDAGSVSLNADEVNAPVRWLKYKYWQHKPRGSYGAPPTTGQKSRSRAGYIRYPRRPWIL